MYQSIRRLLTLEVADKNELSEVEIKKLRLRRLIYIFFFTILYVSCLLLQHGYNKSSPVAKQIRSKIFATELEQLNRIQDQYATPDFDVAMPGSAVADLLNVLQASCRSKALIEDGMTEFFRCDIIRIDWNRTHQNPTHPELPCDYASLETYVEQGDNTPWGEFPSIINEYYRTNNIPPENQSKPIFHLYHRSKALLPLFTMGSEKESGPIPLLHKKINKIGRLIMDRPDVKLNEDKQDRVQNEKLFEDKEVIASSESNESYKITNHIGSIITSNSSKSSKYLVANKNHHWDLLMKCDPEWVTVVFEVSAVEKDKHPLWWKTKLSFSRYSPYLNHYKPNVEITTGLAYQRHHSFTTILPLITIITFCFILFPGSVSSFLLLPYNCYRLVAKKGKFKEIIAHTIDPFGNRINILSWFQILIENLIGFTVMFGFITSIIGIFYGSELCIETAYKHCTPPFVYWSQTLHLQGSEFLGQVLFSLWVKSTPHAIAVLLLFIRLLEISLFSTSTNFLLMTFIFAFVPFAHFCGIFLVLLTAFAILMHAMYGSIYIQFSSIPISFYSLFLYAFGSPFSMTDHGIHFYFEQSAYGAAAMLLLFEIFFVTILLNMFTTIIMNSYSIAIKNVEHPMKMKKVTASLWYQAKRIFGFDDELQEELDTIEATNSMFKSGEESMVLDMALHLPSKVFTSPDKALNEKSNINEETPLIDSSNK
ncbi:uncharacterized protein CMU_008430 [Cryptosporidium muris RN66]|uniref:Polycystin cation channel PKD1/PKD2 domain-containing protein n=1 Tax=Cryptosporidium muris (strain RN66) TaxID=441375 RepID=B6ADR1_CRYMR|nr:uncharacterized protein CMU_008430 [Cryptosporidium muris RN66]EEA06352.1 hypothetical protein, conserved [Cryptosporidium muris RN66]|eukprot:XP_002140701.1 hypothetical protein [Cryptosporidium muris RN66]